MASKNGIRKAYTAPVERTASKALSKSGEALGAGFNTKGLVIAHEHPTPRSDDVGWRCATAPDPDVFHPTDEAALAEAQEFCASCPARDECLALGLARREWGVWGGVLLEAGKPREAPRAAGRPRKVAVA